MSEIKRFNHGVCEYPGGIFSEMNHEADGDYVLHSDHEAEVARLRAEADKYRKDARRWRFVASAPGSVTLRIHNTRADGRDAAIDAAIGGH